VTAIGVYLGPVDPRTPGALTIKKRWALQPLPGQTDQELCVKEFWSKFPEVDQWIKDNARPANIVMNEFLEFCREVVAKVGTKNIKIVTDCPDFDLGRLDYLGHITGTWDRPIRYLGVGVRHQQADPGERLAQMGNGAWAKFETWLKTRAPLAKHSHFPDEDSEYEYYQMLFCNEHVQQ
jgi:hypothetical protein